MGAVLEIRFDHGPDGGAALFRAARGMVVAETLAEVPGALEALDRARRDGFWLAGYASYELGYALEPRLVGRMPARRRLPLIRFGLYDAPRDPEPLPEVGAALGRFAARWGAGEYAAAFARVHDLIGAGDIYQANLTFPLDAEFAGDARALYGALAAHQPVGHGALVLQEGLPDLVSRSPELFFRTDAAGRIQTRPMKGTQPRSADPDEDARRRLWLAGDAKNRAENLMIVDLLRNDISRVARPGTVRVPELFKVETYATVHQMVSTVTADLRPDAGLGDILRALFPCGSITGAPKLRAMQVLRDIEPWSRDIYCGSIGWAAPDGASEFSVAIRTLSVESQRAVLNVGGGVVWDSTAASEYEEALWKTRFASQFQPQPA